MEIAPNRKRLPCRCRNCGTRKTVVIYRKKGDDDSQLEAQRCAFCGRKGFRVDRWRMSNEWHAGGCKCGAYGGDWPHAKGRGKCIYNDKEPNHD